MLKVYSYRVEFEKEEDGRYSAYVPALPGCTSWGKTLDEARVNIAEALQSHLESLVAHKKRVPREKSTPDYPHEETFSIALSA